MLRLASDQSQVFNTEVWRFSDEDLLPENTAPSSINVGFVGVGGGGNRKNGAFAEEEEEEEEEDKNEFDLPEWLAELPDDLEVSTKEMYYCKLLSSRVLTYPRFFGNNQQSNQSQINPIRILISKCLRGGTKIQLQYSIL